MLKKKKEYAFDHLKNTIDKLSCPKCHESFSLSSNGIVCKNNHQFDVSKKGTIHFPLHHMESDYDNEMLMHRRKMIQQGLYEPIETFIAKTLSNQSADKLVVDMGAGEGSLLERLVTQYSLKSQAMGFDLSKEGVLLASDYAKEAFWFIGDVTNMPFMSNSVDVLLNIFSPSHYDEMKRVLTADGIVVKVIPESNYLKELRDVFYYDDVDKQQYSNEKVYQKFLKDMSLVDEQRVTYQFDISPEDYESILLMSPIHWGASEAAKQKARENYFHKLTIDVKILIGKSNHFQK